MTTTGAESSYNRGFLHQRLRVHLSSAIGISLALGLMLTLNCVGIHHKSTVPNGAERISYGWPMEVYITLRFSLSPASRREQIRLYGGDRDLSFEERYHIKTAVTDDAVEFNSYSHLFGIALLADVLLSVIFAVLTAMIVEFLQATRKIKG